MSFVFIVIVRVLIPMLLLLKTSKGFIEMDTFGFPSECDRDNEDSTDFVSFCHTCGTYNSSDNDKGIYNDNVVIIEVTKIMRNSMTVKMMITMTVVMLIIDRELQQQRHRETPRQ